ncbi:hypothetical protein CDAR_244281 [Caerostris darwini]|uniref:Uncharacterized protein n=1 Tax=Caerostris darwini TaxID=1538125 RepID=A0AAV4RIJ7_9ARAC|nr:hypothetical protein CDAR_244281 [Caerostris darwini]
MFCILIHSCGVANAKSLRKSPSPTDNVNTAKNSELLLKMSERFKRSPQSGNCRMPTMEPVNPDNETATNNTTSTTASTINTTSRTTSASSISASPTTSTTSIPITSTTPIPVTSTTPIPVTSTTPIPTITTTETSNDNRGFLGNLIDGIIGFPFSVADYIFSFL